MRSATRAPANPPAEILKNQKSLSVTRKKEQSKWESCLMQDEPGGVTCFSSKDEPGGDAIRHAGG